MSPTRNSVYIVGSCCFHADVLQAAESACSQESCSQLALSPAKTCTAAFWMGWNLWLWGTKLCFTASEGNIQMHNNETSPLFCWFSCEIQRCSSQPWASPPFRCWLLQVKTCWRTNFPAARGFEKIAVGTSLMVRFCWPTLPVLCSRIWSNFTSALLP